MPVINNRDEFAGDSLRRFSGTNRVFADTIEVSAEEIGVKKKTGSEIAGGEIAAQGTLRSAQ